MNHVRAFVRCLLCVLILNIVACLHESPPVSTPAKSDDLAIVAQYLAGRFSSLEQSKSDPDYFDIRLVMFPIWKDRTDGYWLYVEQAVAGHEATPYRQRIYHLKRGRDDLIESVVYVFPDPKKYVGSYNTPAVFDSLKPEELVERDGCAIYLKRAADETFEGGTSGKECASDVKDARYATSEVTLSASSLISWDRGFDQNDKQAWGAEKGGYIFDKLDSFQW